MNQKIIDVPSTKQYLKALLKPDASFFWVVIVYSLVISLLTLAVPISVQMLINTVVNIASDRAVIMLTIMLFSTLVLYGIFSALRLRVMEFYQRRVYARLSSDISRHTLFADHDFFKSHKNSSVSHYYYEIVTLQNNLPILMVDGFALILQMLVGLTVVSFYHPSLFAFNLILILCLYFAWRLWSGGAIKKAIELSHAKYATGNWINQIALAHPFFSSTTTRDFALSRTDNLISDYLHKHSDYFFYTFSQAISFLLIYALASAALLGLGGYLVIHGQMSIGQLVAAELIMLAVLFGLSRFNRYLELYYELYGAADKITTALKTPQAPPKKQGKAVPEIANLRFKQVLLKRSSASCLIDLTLDAGKKYAFVSLPDWLIEECIKVLKYAYPPVSGWIGFGDSLLTDYDSYALGQEFIVVDDSLIVECTIREFLLMSSPHSTSEEIIRALETVEIYKVIREFPDELETSISKSGYPLQKIEFLLLKLAAATLAQPKVLIIGRQFDALHLSAREQIIRILGDQTMLLHFTDIPNSEYNDGLLRLHASQEQLELRLHKTAPESDD